MNTEKVQKNNYVQKAIVAIISKFKVIKTSFKEGDILTKLSFAVMGISNLGRGQIVKGMAFLLSEIVFISYMMYTGIDDVLALSNLGTTQQGWAYNETLGIDILQDGDNSMLILLYGIFAAFIIIAFIGIWAMNIKSSIKVQRLVENNQKVPKFKEEIKEFSHDKLHISLMTLPLIGIFSFTVLPLAFMILIAFTNYDNKHQPPGNLFTWVGLQNFKTMLNSAGTISSTFWPVLQWTLVWAVIATITTYIGGILMALLINKKNVKLRGFWRTLFVTSMAIPQFVSLLSLRTMLRDEGAVNVLLQQLGIISQPIQFITSTTLARVTVIMVNIWIGVPFTMLTVTGILINIPKDLYEAAKVDGANAFVIFMKITMPYILFITAPKLITDFIGNINNFNLIYLLTEGGPANLNYFQAGKTDLLVTWLYKLTVDGKQYCYASTIGIVVFIISIVISLICYRRTAAYKEEGDFS